MSDEDLLTDDERDNLDPNIREELKKSRKLQRESADKDRRIEALERNALFSEVGVLKDGVGELVRNSYSGELTQEAVKAFAERYPGALASSAAPAPASTGFDNDLARLQKLQTSTAGDGGAAPDPAAELHAAIVNAPDAKSLREVLAAADPSLLQLVSRGSTN